MPELNFNELESKVQGMSKEDLIKALVDIKSKQAIATKKYYNPEKAKEQRRKQAAVREAMVAKAKELGIYDEIVKTAREVADEKLAEQEESEELATQEG